MQCCFKNCKIHLIPIYTEFVVERKLFCLWGDVIKIFYADGDGDEEKLRDNQHQLGAAVQKLIKTRTRPLRQQQKKRNHLYS